MQMWLTRLMRHCPVVLEKAAGAKAAFSAGEGTGVCRADQMHRRKSGNFLEFTDSLTEAF